MLELHVFNVDKGQSVGLRLPNGRWCLFDAACTDSLHPIDSIVANEQARYQRGLQSLLNLQSPSFRFLKATISHLHGDHLYDFKKMMYYLPEFLKSVQYDEEHLKDVHASSTTESYRLITDYLTTVSISLTGQIAIPAYGDAAIREISLPVHSVRQFSSSANSRVNNSSIISRIDCYSRSILICGDMEAEAWEYALNGYTTSGEWVPFVSNVDILVAPHHGHQTGYSTTLMNLAKPKLVIASVDPGNENVDSRYSSTAVSGISQNFTTYKLLTTRKHGNITVKINPPFLSNAGSIQLDLEKNR